MAHNLGRTQAGAREDAGSRSADRQRLGGRAATGPGKLGVTANPFEAAPDLWGFIEPVLADPARAAATGPCLDPGALDPRVFAQILRESQDPRLTALVLLKLSTLNHGSVTQVLVRFRGQSAPEVRRAALAGLARLRTPESMEALLPGLADPDPQVAADGARLFAEAPAEITHVLILGLAEAREPARRELAALALGAMPPAVATGILLTLAGDANAGVQRAALSQLERLGDASAAQELRGMALGMAGAAADAVASAADAIEARLGAPPPPSPGPPAVSSPEALPPASEAPVEEDPFEAIARMKRNLAAKQAELMREKEKVGADAPPSPAAAAALAKLKATKPPPAAATGGAGAFDTTSDFTLDDAPAPPPRKAKRTPPPKEAPEEIEEVPLDEDEPDGTSVGQVIDLDAESGSSEALMALIKPVPKPPPEPAKPAPERPREAAAPGPAAAGPAGSSTKATGGGELRPGATLGSRDWMHGLLHELVLKGGSDLHFQIGMPPRIRVDGQLVALERPAPTKEEILRGLTAVSSSEQLGRFMERGDLSFAYGARDIGRFRCSYYKHSGELAAVFRLIPTKIPTAADLGLPESALELVSSPSGLVLIAGPAGSGRSTTLACLVEGLNEARAGHIVTLEDPIEYLHADKRGTVIQREVGADTMSFADGLRATARQDADVIVAADLKDRAAVEAALEAAGSGRLVLGSIEARSADQALADLTAMFKAEARSWVRSALARNLCGVIAQALPPKKGGGRVAAYEILIGTPEVAAAIRSDQPDRVREAHMMGTRHGMRTLEQALTELIEKGLVEYEDAILRAARPAEIPRPVAMRGAG